MDKKDMPGTPLVQQAFKDLMRPKQHRACQTGVGLASREQAAKEQAEKDAVRQQEEHFLHSLGGELGNAQQQPAPAGEMDQALAAVSQVNKALDDAVTRLERRLGRLMRLEPEGKAPNACQMMASLPMEIRARAACTQDSVDRLVL